jgi:hypothetical protein
MLTVGVALFATFSGFLANAFLSSKQPKPSEPEAESDLVGVLREIERLSAEQQAALDRLRATVAELKRAS